MSTFFAPLIESATVAVINCWLLNLGKIDKSALHFFNRNARVSAPALVSLNSRLGTVQQLFRSHPGDDD